MTERRMLPDSFALPVAPATASNLVSANSFFAALEAAGMPKASEEFSVLPQHQVIPSSVVAEIATFVRIFDRITTRDAWRIAALRGVPVIATLRRSETCFFSAWDFHLSPEGNWQLIEFNDNGSGFIFAAIINSLYYEATRQEQNRKIIAPISVSRFKQHIGDLVEREAEAFFGSCPDGLFVVLDDSTSLERGKFRRELDLLCDLLRRRRRRSEVAVPAELCWDGTNLLLSGQAVSFIVNRSTDFFWESADFGALRRAYEIGGVYMAPNPFTYATRSDKRLLEWLALPHWDNDLGIELEERELLHSHVPETHLIRTENVEELARRKQEFVFKPLHGFAGRGLLESAAIGRARLRRLATRGDRYIAQRWAPKSSFEIGGTTVWTDLRVWAYRGEILQLSGRASRRPDRLDLTPPGGWVPTYASI